MTLGAWLCGRILRAFNEHHYIRDRAPLLVLNLAAGATTICNFGEVRASGLESFGIVGPREYGEVRPPLPECVSVRFGDGECVGAAIEPRPNSQSAADLDTSKWGQQGATWDSAVYGADDGLDRRRLPSIDPRHMERQLLHRTAIIKGPIEDLELDAPGQEPWAKLLEADVSRNGNGFLSGFGGFAGLLHRVAGGLKGLPDQGRADDGDGPTERRYYQRPQTPPRGVFLSHQVAFGALVLVCGLYYLLDALRHIEWREDDTTIAYLLLGVLGVGIGVGFIFAYGLAS